MNSGRSQAANGNATEPIKKRRRPHGTEQENDDVEKRKIDAEMGRKKKRTMVETPDEISQIPYSSTANVNQGQGKKQPWKDGNLSMDIIDGYS